VQPVGADALAAHQQLGGQLAGQGAASDQVAPPSGDSATVL
jgi:hypothetical protein